MGKKGKYAGGSVLKTFRLPADHFKEAEKFIEDYLDGFRNSASSEFRLGYKKTTPEELAQYAARIKKSGPDPKLDPLVFETLALDPEMSEARPEERIPGTLKKKGLGKGQQMRSEKKIDAPRHITYDCGCADDGVLFRRNPSCQLDKDQHKRIVLKNSNI